MESTYHVKASLPGRVIGVLVKEKDVVTSFQDVVVLEAMKIENYISVEDAGTVKEILVSTGDIVVKPANILWKTGSVYRKDDTTLANARNCFEREYILRVLNKAGCKITKTAQELSIARKNLYRKMKEHNINN